MNLSTFCFSRLSFRLALVVGLFPLGCRTGGPPHPRPGDQRAPNQTSLCELLERVAPGQRLAGTVTGLYWMGFEEAVLYDPSHRNCELDVQPETTLEFARETRRYRGLERLLHRDHRAYVTVRGMLWGPPEVPADDLSQPEWLSSRNRAMAGRQGYGHLDWARTKFVVEEIIAWRPVPSEEPSWGEGSRPFPISSMPELIGASVPTYPQQAEILGVSGEVTVEVNVNRGSVESFEVRSGDRLLVPAVEQNLRSWRFNPGAKADFTTTYTFSLEPRSVGEDRSVQVSANLPLWAKVTAAGPVSAGKPSWAESERLLPTNPIPAIVSAALPLYPGGALFGGLSGEVVVEVTVKDGRVVATRPKSGDRMLVQAVEENTRAWRFSRGVNATLTTTVTFELELRKLGSDRNARVELRLPLSARIVAPYYRR